MFKWENVYKVDFSLQIGLLQFILCSQKKEEEKKKRKVKRDITYLQVMPNVGLGEGYGQISWAGLAL